jgi:hypothetical protein
MKRPSLSFTPEVRLGVPPPKGEETFERWSDRTRTSGLRSRCSPGISRRTREPDRSRFARPARTRAKAASSHGRPQRLHGVATLSIGFDSGFDLGDRLVKDHP